VVKGVAPTRFRDPKKMEIFDIFGAAFPPPGAIEVKFCTAKPTQVPVGLAKFDLNRCNESPTAPAGEKPDFWPVSKNNTGSLPLGGNPAGNKHHIFAPTAGAHCAIYPKLCTVIELVVPIIKGVIHFFDPALSFCYRVHGKIWPNLRTRGFSAITR